MAVSGSKRNWFSDRIRSGRRRVSATRFRPDARSRCHDRARSWTITTDRRPRDFVKITAAIESMSRSVLLAATVPSASPFSPRVRRSRSRTNAPRTLSTRTERASVHLGGIILRIVRGTWWNRREIRDGDPPYARSRTLAVSAFSSRSARERTAAATFHRWCAGQEKER